MNGKHSSNQRQRSAKKTSLENFKFLHRIVFTKGELFRFGIDLFTDTAAILN